METNEKRILSAFNASRKLNSISPSKGQIENIVFRLQQIFTNEELSKMDEKTFMRQIERVWPIAQYIDNK